MKLNIKWSNGDIVYLKTDTEQLPRMITAIIVRETGIIYELSQGVGSSDHYEIEFQSEEDQLIKLQHPSN